MLFVGDEVSALGFRLAGVEVVVADGKDGVPELDEAVAVVIATHDVAAQVVRQDHGIAVLPVASLASGGEAEDLGQRVRRELGIGE